MKPHDSELKLRLAGGCLLPGVPAWQAGAGTRRPYPAPYLPASRAARFDPGIPASVAGRSADGAETSRTAMASPGVEGVVILGQMCQTVAGALHLGETGRMVPVPRSAFRRGVGSRRREG